MSHQITSIGWQVALSAIIMWISGRISFEIPALSVPITLQSMVAILLPLCLIGRYASGGILIWLILGALGLPFFADGNGGYQYFYSNSGGYLLGFYLISILTSIITQNITLTWFKVGLIFLSMHLVLIIIGLLWIWSGGYSEIKMNSHISPYLPGMIFKCFLGTLLHTAYNTIHHRIFRQSK